MNYSSVLLTVLGTILTVQTAIAAPTLKWSATVDSGASSSDRCKALGAMTNGDVIAASQVGSGTSAQIRVQRLAANNGVALWTRNVDTENFADEPVDIAVDPATGDSYIAARVMTASSGLDWLVFKVNGADGTLGWGANHTFGSTGNDEPRAISFAQDGHIIVAGMTSVSGVSNGEVSKLNSSTGAVLASVSVNGGSIDLFDVACDASGNVIVAGRFDNDALVVKYASVVDGSLNSPATERFNPGGKNCWNSVVFISGGNFAVAGYTSAGGNQNFSVARYASSLGAPAWTREIAGNANESEAAFDVTVDGAGDVYSAGFLRDSANGQVAHLTKLNGGTGAILWGVSKNGSSANVNATDAFYSVRISGTDVLALGTQANATPDIILTRYTAAGVIQEDTVFNGAANNHDTSLGRNLLATSGTIVFLGGDTENATLSSDGIVRSYNLVDKSVSITALDAAKAEGNGGGTTNYTFTVARSGDLAGAVTLDWTVAGSSASPANVADFAAMSGQVTLNATEASKTLNVVVNADTIVEPNEGFTVTLSNPTNGYVLTTATADGVINNDDSATLTLTGGASVPEGNSGTTNQVFTATLSAAVQGGFSVAYATNDDTATLADNDYIDNDSSLTFTGSANEQHTITVLIDGDTKVEANETFTVTLGAVTGGHGGITVAGSPQTATITNDDSASISISDVTQLEGGGAMNFSVTLTALADVSVTVDFATADGTAVAPGDYTANSGTITFPANSIAAQTVPVTVVNDGDTEADETFFVNLTNLNASGRSVAIADGMGLGTIQNDDNLTISITATDDSADENSGGTNLGVWRVSRNGTFEAVTANLEVDLTSTALAADWTQTGASFVSMAPGGIGSVTIPDGQSFVDITLTPVDDLAAEADETVQLNVTAGTGYTPSNSLTRTVTIGRNDFAVTNVNDSGEGTLRQAVDNAEVLGGAPTITFVGAVFSDAVADTITLGGTPVVIRVPLTIDGPGADLLTISGNGASYIIGVAYAGDVTLRGMTLTEGRTISGGVGGAVYSSGPPTNLLIEQCVITDNHSNQDSGAVHNADGATMMIRDSTISGNSEFGSGISAGGILNSANLTLVNTTVSGNESTTSTNATQAGGGIMSFGNLTVLNSTITGNRTGVAGPAGGIRILSGSLTMHNSLLAGNVSGPASTPSDLTGSPTPLVATYNLIGDAASSGGITDGTNGNIVGNAGMGTLGIATVLDTVLSNNGGLFPTHKLVVGSPAIDAGDPAFDGSTFTPALTNDQRGTGFVRVTKGLASSSAARIDIGAYELIEAPVFTEDDLEINTGSMQLDLSTASGVTPAGGTFSGTGVSGGFFDPTGLALGAYTVTYTVTDGSGNANSTNLTVTVTERPSLTVTAIGDVVSKIDGQTSLREALAYAGTLTGPQTVEFSNTTTNGSVNFHDAVPKTILLGGTQLEIVGLVTIEGPGADLLTIDGNAASRVFAILTTNPANDVTITSLTIANGSADDGGGLRIRAGIVSVENCVFSSNVASDDGGAIHARGETLTLTDCVFLNNHASEGGAIDADSDGAYLRCHFEGNTADSDGGALKFGGDALVISASVFTLNDATDEGGALENNGTDLTLVNCTISGNTAGTAGGGINNQDRLTLVNCTVTGNRADADGLEATSGTPDEGLGGGGIRTDDDRGLVTLYNTIVAGNRRGAPGSDVAADLSTALPADIGVDPASANNLVGDPGFVGELVHGVNGNIIGKEDGAGPRIEWPVVEILNPILSDNGGLSLTHSLVIGSPAIDAGDNALAVDEASAPLVTDQRGAGFTRVVKGLALFAAATVDMGAYELFASPIFARDQLSVVTGGSPLDLALETGVNPAGGIFSGMGVSGGLFDPGALTPGDYLVTYTVTDAFGVENAATLIVTVTNLPSELKVDRPKRFKPTPVGRKGETQRIRITNAGGLPLEGLNVRLSGPHRKDFRLVKPPLKTLAPSASTTYRITFKPRAAGVRKATVTVTGGGEVSAAPVKGVGISSGPGFPVRDPDKFENRE